MSLPALFSKNLITHVFVFSGRLSKRIVGTMQGGDSDEDVSPNTFSPLLCLLVLGSPDRLAQVCQQLERTFPTHPLMRQCQLLVAHFTQMLALFPTFSLFFPFSLSKDGSSTSPLR